MHAYRRRPWRTRVRGGQDRFQSTHGARSSTLLSPGRLTQSHSVPRRHAPASLLPPRRTDRTRRRLSSCAGKPSGRPAQSSPLPALDTPRHSPNRRLAPDGVGHMAMSRLSRRSTHHGRDGASQRQSAYASRPCRRTGQKPRSQGQQDDASSPQPPNASAISRVSTLSESKYASAMARAALACRA